MVDATLVDESSSISSDYSQILNVHESFIPPPSRDRVDSELLFRGSGAIINPHLLQSSNNDRHHTAERRLNRQNVAPTIHGSINTTDCSLLPGGVNSMHELNTEMTGNCDECGEDLDLHSFPGLAVTKFDTGCEVHVSLSPSPLPEPIFEPYVICTKTRSETSCSNESQCSFSSNERDDSASLSSLGIQNSPPGPCRSYQSKHLSLSVPQERLVVSSENEEESGKRGKTLMLISPEHDSPQPMEETKLILPPPNYDDSSESDHSIPMSPLYFPSINPPRSNPLPRSRADRFLSSSVSNIDFRSTLATQRTLSHSFFACNVGEESGQFNADYLGMKEIDMYTKSINLVAKELLSVDQRPKEVHVYVSSEKIRIAPPNSVTLFQSLAVKDVLLIRKCSKNKRIIGIMVWRQKNVIPSCHVLRCQDNLIADSLYDAIWQQTQKVDDVQPKEDQSSRGVPARPLSCQTDLSSSSGDNLSSATHFLHSFQAIYVGCVPTGKNHSIDHILDKVLIEARPSQAKKVTLSLSLLEIQLIHNEGINGLKRKIFLSHETSRIRTMGAFSADKRFAGYIVKEEGKPQMGHVIRCNSAALMVSFMSFLRQSCQLTSHQRGGSFYEELSTDDSGDGEASTIENSSSSVNDNSGIICRIRSLTSSISQLTSHSSPSLPSPSFQSHMQQDDPSMSPIHRTKSKVRDSIISPLDFTEEDYAKFPVTYIGSATQDHPLTRHSIEEALNQFASEGKAAGQAAVLKNIVYFQISVLGINLADKTRKLFIHRNYPRNTLAGYSRHPTDTKVFAFASLRPGFTNIIKVHVFRCGVEPVEQVEQVMDAIKYWLKIDPVL